MKTFSKLQFFIFLVCCCSIFMATTEASAQGLEGVIVEEYNVNSGSNTVAGVADGAITYRIFLDLKPGYKLINVFGIDTPNDPGNDLLFTTTTGFYNEPAFGVTYGDANNSALFNVFKGTALDSYHSFGGAASGQRGIQKVNDTDGSNLVPFLGGAPDGYVTGTTPAAAELGVSISGTLEGIQVNGADSLFTFDGSFYVLGGTTTTGPDDVIYIGQFTTDGDFSFRFNIQVLDPNGDPEIYTHSEILTIDGLDSQITPSLTFPLVVGGLPGCTDLEACNFDGNATEDDGSCIVPVANCSECNATGDGLDPIDADADGVCDADEIAGCQTLSACNFNLSATDDDGSCIVPIPNCQECNATGDGLIIVDADADGTCDADDGCPNDADKLAPGTCGCGVVDTDSDLDGVADCNDGCPNDAAKTAPGACGCGTSDSDTNGNGVPDCDDVLGCTAPSATNFDPNANLDDGSCDFGGGETLACDGLPGGLEGVIVEEYNVNSGTVTLGGVPDGAITYRIFLDLKPGYKLINVFGINTPSDPGNDLLFTTTTGFYNEPAFGVTYGDQNNTSLFPVFSGTALDSYTSFGGAANGQRGIPKANDADGSNVVPFLSGTPPDGYTAGSTPAAAELGVSISGTLEGIQVNGADSLYTFDGSFYVLGGTTTTGPDDVIYIGQFTTDGEFSYRFNIQVLDPNGDPEIYTHSEILTIDGLDSRICSDLTFPSAPLTPGCTDVLACNFDADAETDDGSCVVPEANCTECNATNDGLDLIDDDGDGVCNALEDGGCTDALACNFDPNVDPANDNGTCILPEANCTECNATDDGLILIDADNDGTCDAEDGCVNDPNKIAPGDCGCGVADADSDLDGTPDCNDGCPNDPNKLAPGSCGCGVPDLDSDNDGTPNCNDACPNDPDKLAPGACGCGVADTDSDNDEDGPDCIDPCPLLPNLANGDDCDLGNGETGFVQDCQCVEGAQPQCISPVACNYFDPTGLVDGIDYINTPSLCDEPIGCKSCDTTIDADDVTNGVPTPDGDGIGASIVPSEFDVNGNNVCDDEEEQGCTSLTACNYDVTAVIDDGSCFEPVANCYQCIRDAAGNANGGIIFIDSDGDGICNASEILGCTDPIACNFDADATDNDGSCNLPEAGCSECDGDVVLVIDADGNGTPDCEEVFGCTTVGACNYNPEATIDNGSCLIAVENCSRCLTVRNTVILLPIDDDQDGICNANEIPGCTSVTACNYNPSATDNNNTCFEPFEDCLICADNGEGLLLVDTDFDGICDADEIPGCTDATACNFNELATDENGSCTFEVAGCTSCVNGQLIIQDNDLDGICNSEDPDDDNDGCLDADDPAPLTASADADGDGVGNDCDICDGDDASGDTDGDGICDDSEIAGCTEPTACNFNAEATDDDGSCDVPVENCTVCLNGDLVLLDSDGDKVCNADEIPGCDDEAACNFNEDATDNDGSCEFVTAGCSECLNGTVSIIDTDGDGICDADEVIGCTNPTACNFNAAATDDNGSCLVPVADCLECNTAGTALVLVDADNDGICDADEDSGCTDASACNFDHDATEDDGSCLIPVPGCTKCDVVNGEVVLVTLDADGDGICNADEVIGCTLQDACNYNPDATDAANATCILATEDCTVCGLITLPNGNTVIGLILVDADGDKICNADEIPGCTNTEASNFDVTATDDDGSCEFDVLVGNGCQGFEGGFNNWSNLSSDNIDWTANSGSTPSNGTAILLHLLEMTMYMLKLLSLITQISRRF